MKNVRKKAMCFAVSGTIALTVLTACSGVRPQENGTSEELLTEEISRGGYTGE